MLNQALIQALYSGQSPTLEEAVDIAKQAAGCPAHVESAGGPATKLQ